MKNINLLLACGLMVASPFFESCKKQIDEPKANENVSQALSVSATNCKSEIYGTYETGSGIWTTIMQKWYSNNRIQFFKSHFSGRPGEDNVFFYSEPLLNIDWGEVTYEGDQVRVRDVGKDKLVFRATLDQSGKPVASYLYNYATSSNEWVFIDTSYYYYAGDRLSYIIQLFEKRFNDGWISRAWEQYTFTYDARGDLGYYFAKNQQVTGGFIYGSTPVTGNVADYFLTTSYRMLEFLDLIRVPMNHQLYQMNITNYNPRTGVPHKFYEKNFYNYSIINGLVQSYLYPYYSDHLDYYIGWNCSGALTASAVNKKDNVITNLDQFNQLYPGNKK